MNARRILDDAQVEEACAMRERGSSLRAIADHFSAAGLPISQGSISWTCLRAGADLPPQKRRPRCAAPAGRIERRGNHVVRRFTAEEDAQLVAMELQGLSIAEIARRMQRKHNSIVGRLATLARIDARQEETA